MRRKFEQRMLLRRYCRDRRRQRYLNPRRNERLPCVTATAAAGAPARAASAGPSPAGDSAARTRPVISRRGVRSTAAFLLPPCLFIAVLCFLTAMPRADGGTFSLPLPQAPRAATICEGTGSCGAATAGRGGAERGGGMSSRLRAALVFVMEGRGGRWPWR
jgi:hypothetical protein